MKAVVLILTTLLLYSQVHAEEKCTKEQAKEAVLKMCKIVEEKGEAAKEDLQKFRFCGENYVWIQDSDVKMVMHPIKPKLIGTDLKGQKDEKGFPLFLEFGKKASESKDGGWVDYVWPKPKAETATPKTSFVKRCGGPLKWIVGSGVWKD